MEYVLLYYSYIHVVVIIININNLYINRYDVY